MNATEYNSAKDLITVELWLFEIQTSLETWLWRIGVLTDGSGQVEVHATAS